MKIQKARIRQSAGLNGSHAPDTPVTESGSGGWGSVPESPAVEKPLTQEDESSEEDKEKADKGKEKATEERVVKKFRGIPENVKLFEVFWHQVVELIKVRLQRPANHTSH